MNHPENRTCEECGESSDDVDDCAHCCRDLCDACMDAHECIVDRPAEYEP